jgi:photosystem II stability/assembly factor-like uncharacterized protein
MRKTVTFMSLLSLAFLTLLWTPVLTRAASWTTHGPASKVIKAVAISPQDTSVIFAGAFGWGVFRSTDGGASWTNSRVGMINSYVRSLAALSSSVVFCGTNDGVYKSIDSGSTWNRVVGTPFSVRSLAYDAKSGNLYAAAYGSGLYKTTDQGASWTNISVTDPTGPVTLSHLWSVAVFGQDSLYVGGALLDVSTGGALFRSLDGGATWVQVQRSLHIASSVRAIAINPTAPEFGLIIGTASKGVYRTTNGGVNWSNVSDTGLVNALPDLHVNAVAHGPSLRFAGTDSLGGAYARSTVDATTGWTAGTGLPGRAAIVSSIALNQTNQSTVFVGTEGQGVYRSGNAGASWAARNSGMLGTAAREIRRNGNGQLLLGTDFGDGIWTSTDHGTSWTQDTSLNTANAITAIAITNASSIVYAAAYGSGIYKSTDAGVTWAITDSTVINHFPRALEAVPGTSTQLFAGTGNGVYKTTNGGLSWQAANNGIPASTSIRAMAIDPVSTNNIYVGTDSLFLYRSIDGGGSWLHVTSGFLPQDVFIRTITVDYASPATLYAGSDSGRIYKSTNSGANWSLMSSPAATHSVRSILIHPTIHHVLFAATFGDGIFVSVDDGAHWQTLNTGLADLSIYTLESDQASPLNLYAGSSDFGVYQISYAYVNHPPHLASIGSKSVLQNQLLAFTVTASDSDGTIPALSASGLPAGATFTDSLNGHGSFRWTPGVLGSFSVKILASDGVSADSQLVSITVLDSLSNTVISLPVEEGWNLVSLPVVRSDARVAVVFPEASSSAYAYGGSYAIKDTLQNGPGYWLKFPSSLTLLVGGVAVAAETVSVRTGWNIIGSVSQPIIAGSLTPVPPVVVTSSIYGYSASAGYSLADSLRPGSGYWLKSNHDGTIILPAPAAEGAVGKTVAANVPNAVPDAFVSLTDSRGRRRDLILLPESTPREALAGYELPPAPPAGGFDVRFEATQGAGLSAGATAERLPVLVRTEDERLLVAWDVRKPGMSLELATGRAADPSLLPMAGKGAAEINVRRGDSELFLVVAPSGAPARDLPGRVELSQNYPNPFNPSTVIAYSLPARALVKIVVFDVLGREVQRLAGGEQDAGTHRVVWDASGVSSGVYYYQLEVMDAADPSRVARETKKMFLIR